MPASSTTVEPDVCPLVLTRNSSITCSSVLQSAMFPQNGWILHKTIHIGHHCQHNNLRIIALFLAASKSRYPATILSALKVCVGKIVQYYTIIDIKQFVCLDWQMILQSFLDTIQLVRATIQLVFVDLFHRIARNLTYRWIISYPPACAEFGVWVHCTADQLSQSQANVIFSPAKRFQITINAKLLYRLIAKPFSSHLTDISVLHAVRIDIAELLFSGLLRSIYFLISKQLVPQSINLYINYCIITFKMLGRPIALSLSLLWISTIWSGWGP